MMKEIEKLDKKIEKTETEMDLVDQQIKAKEGELKKEQASLEEATQNAQIQYDTMKKRIKYMYENGNQDYIDILFSSKSIADLLNNAEYVDKISEYDRSMFANYKKTWDEMNTRKAAVESMIETLKSKKLEQKEDHHHRQQSDGRFLDVIRKGGQISSAQLHGIAEIRQIGDTALNPLTGFVKEA